MKLAVNTVIFGLNGALAEALVLAEQAGIDRAVAYDVFAASAAGAPFVGYKRAAFIEPDATPAAFALALAEKDLGLITELADDGRHAGAPGRHEPRADQAARRAAAEATTSRPSRSTCARGTAGRRGRRGRANEEGSSA